jgi:hypothetical protein
LDIGGYSWALLVENGGRYHQAFFGPDATKSTIPVIINILILAPVTDSFTILRNSLQQIKVGKANVEDRDNSTIVAVEGNWQNKRGIVQHLQINRFNPTI